MGIVLSKFFIDDKVKVLKKFKIKFYKKTDENDFPSTDPMGGVIKMTFDVTERNDTDFFTWMKEKNLQKKGKICFYAPDGIKEEIVYEFWDGFCIDYKDIFNSYGKPLQTKLIISAGVIKKNGSIFQKYWRETDANRVPSIDSPIFDHKPTVNSVYWVKPQSKDLISESNYGSAVGIWSFVNHAQGGSAKITISKKDGANFDKTNNTLIFTEAVGSNGVITLSSLKIKELWEDFKIADKDQLVAEVTHRGTKGKSNALTIVPSPKVLVNFRPNSNYKGEFGFDWMRVGDTKKPGDESYKNIVGNYKKGAFTASNSDYIKLGEEYKKHTHPLRPSDFYLEPILTLLPNKSAKLTLKVEIEGADAKQITFKYNNTYLKLNKTEVSHKTVGKKELANYLEITCIKEFGADQTIEVLSDNKFAGKLKVLANDKAHRYKADVVFVEVETTLFGGGKSKTGLSNGEESFIEKYLNQALIKPSVIVKELDLTNDSVLNSKYRLVVGNTAQINDISGIHTHLENEFSKIHPGYSSYFKVFFFNEEGGEILSTGYQGYNGAAKAINSKSVVLYNTHNTSTTSHELLHAMGLYHSFSGSGDFTFEKEKTENIMDYSHNIGIDRISTWQWQWQTIWPNVTKE